MLSVQIFKNAVFANTLLCYPKPLPLEPLPPPYPRSPGWRCRSSRKLTMSDFESMSLTQERHLRTAHSELRNASSCILISSETIGSMKTQKLCRGGGGEC